MLGSLFMPKVAGPIMGGLLILVLAGAGWHFWTVRGLERDVAQAERATAEAREQHAECKAALSDVTANRDQLVTRIEARNAAIERFRDQAREAEARAELLSSQVLRQAEVTRRAIVDDPESGPGRMNQWFAEQF